MSNTETESTKSPGSVTLLKTITFNLEIHLNPTFMLNTETDPTKTPGYATLLKTITFNLEISLNSLFVRLYETLEHLTICVFALSLSLSLSIYLSLCYNTTTRHLQKFTAFSLNLNRGF